MMLIGVGGGGNNVVKRIAENTDLDLDLIAVNTDHKQLKSLTSDNITKIQIGTTLTKGLGCGGNANLGHEAAENDAEVIKQALKGADMVFLTAGLGAGTGTGVAEGSDATNPGCGGGGAATERSGSALDGGDGQDGIVIVWEYA